jgi:hypothetical protein
MSAFRGKADIPDPHLLCPLLTHNGHLASLGRNDMARHGLLQNQIERGGPLGATRSLSYWLGWLGILLSSAMT